MIGFTLQLVVRSWRWVPVSVLYLVIALLVFEPPGPALHAAATMFLPHLAIALWLGLITGNIDDDGHRDMMSAMTGSPRRLHRQRALGAALASAPLVAVTALASLAGASARGPAVSFVVVGLTEGSAVALGTALATWLHRPILRHAGAASLAAIGSLVAIAVSPPVASLLRSLNDGTTRLVVPATLVTVGTASGSVRLASSVAGRRNG